MQPDLESGVSRSLRFPVAVHILVALAFWREEYVSSEVLAKTVATNPVVVRRILQALKRAGLVKSRGGVNGGTMLAVEPKKITLLDVCDAAEEAEAGQIHEGHPNCPIAQTIRQVVPGILNEVEAARRDGLQKFTIAELLGEVRKIGKGGVQKTG